MNSEVVATIRAALVMKKNHHLFSSGCSADELVKMNTEIAAVNAALAALDEAAGWEMLPDGPIPDSNLYVTVAHPDGWFLEFGKNGAKIWFPDVVRLFRKRQPAQGA